MFEFSDKAQTLRVFNFLADTREFIGAGDAYIPAHTGLPANCTTMVLPEIPAGKVAIFDEQKQFWSLVEDHRGQTVYDPTNGQAIFISVLGPLPDNTVSSAPNGEYEKWNGNAWIKDEKAEKNSQVNAAQNEKSQRIREATQQMEILNDSIGFDGGQVGDAEALKGWTTYRVLLNRIDVNKAPNITWPNQPN